MWFSLTFGFCIWCPLCSSSRLQIMEHEGDMVRAKCIPRKSKTLPTKKEEGTSSSMDSVSRSQHGSKRFEGQQ